MLSATHDAGRGKLILDFAAPAWLDRDVHVGCVLLRRSSLDWRLADEESPLTLARL